jgi:hypothetical protein
MKRDKNYKMSKRLKTLLALLPFKNKEARNSFKNNMIDAEIASQAQNARKKVFT